MDGVTLHLLSVFWSDAKDPAILCQQRVEEAQPSIIQAVHAEDPEVQYLLGPTALSLLL